MYVLSVFGGIRIRGWIGNMTKLDQIKKIADKWHEERYDTDWDTLQGSLMKIWRIVNKK